MKKLIFINGASGTGKTTAVKAIDAKHLPGILFHYFDSIGIPSTEEMIVECGSIEEWQRQRTIDWVKQISRNPEPVQVIDGQVRHSFIDEACALAGIKNYSIITFVCADNVRDKRVIARGQPELANPDMANWNRYLEAEANKRGNVLIDTSDYEVGRAARELEAIILS